MASPVYHKRVSQAWDAIKIGVLNQRVVLDGVPKGIRTPVTAVRGRCPRPLDDGDVEAVEGAFCSEPGRRDQGISSVTGSNP